MVGESVQTDTKTRYDILREQVNRENDLYYNRLNWLVASQSLLITAQGVLLSALLDIAPEDVNRKAALIIAMIMTGFVGLSIAIITHFTLRGTRKVLDSIEQHWNQLNGTSDFYPHVRGGDGIGASSWVLPRSGWLPFIFGGAWIATPILLLNATSIAEFLNLV